MSHSFSDLNLLKFIIFDTHQSDELFESERYSHLDKEQALIMIESALALAERDIFPYFQEMDRQPAEYDGHGKVITHPQLKTIIANAAEQGWIGASAAFEHGGMQVPESINNAAQHIFQAANNSVQGYLGLSAGAARLITTFGTMDQVERFVKPIFEGKWQGTMALTEPQAGSSLTDIKTSATPTENDNYAIKGQKIFISAGQHEACDNFVHLTLARIEGAPAGVKGISLFIIPKYRPNDDGTLDYNDVYCAGEYQKMGQKGYATTHLVFGEDNNCKGYLVGEPNKGLTYMFQLMNEARIGVGQTAASVALAAYKAALKYAQERSQGRLPSEKDPSKDPVLLIKHADVQRMLFTQKVIAEGALCLAFYCNKKYDLEHVLTGKEKEDNHLLLELLTPIIKAYASEEASRSASLAIQVLGGYGYTLDFPVQQHYRDIKIMAIYEGTTGIQSMDLLGRKVTIKEGRALQLLTKEISVTIAQAKENDALKPYAASLETSLDKLLDVSKHLLKFAKEGELERYLSDANVYMEMAGHIVVAWEWLKMGKTAINLKQRKDHNYSDSFLDGKIHAMQFFFKYELPKVNTCTEILKDEKWLTAVEDVDQF